MGRYGEIWGDIGRYKEDLEARPLSRPVTLTPAPASTLALALPIPYPYPFPYPFPYLYPKP